MENIEVEVVYTFREENNLADFLANHIIHFAGTTIKKFNNIQDLPQQERKILLTEQRKFQICRLRRCKTRDSNNKQAFND